MTIRVGSKWVASKNLPGEFIGQTIRVMLISDGNVHYDYITIGPLKFYRTKKDFLSKFKPKKSIEELIKLCQTK